MLLKATRKQIIHAKVTAAAYGEVATFAATDAILCGDITVDPVAISDEQRKIIQSFFGSMGTINVKEQGKISFATEWVGSGTAGTAPRFGALFLGCNFNQVITAAPVTGTAQAGGSTTTIKLAAGASAVDDFYLGMRCAITGGTGSGSYSRIIGYNGTSKIATVATPFSAATDATSLYSISANVAYLPHSSMHTNFGADVCIRYNRDGVEHIFLGGRGNVQLKADPNKIPYLQWDFTGLIGTITDTAAAAADFTGIPVSNGVLSAYVDNVNIHGLVSPNVVLSAFSLDVGNQVSYPDLVAQDVVLITDRQSKLNTTVLATTLAIKNWWTAARTMVDGKLCLTLGKTAGNQCSIVCGAIQPKTVKYGDVSGITTNEIEFEVKPYGTGNNEVVFVFD